MFGESEIFLSKKIWGFAIGLGTYQRIAKFNCFQNILMFPFLERCGVLRIAVGLEGFLLGSILQ